MLRVPLKWILLVLLLLHVAIIAMPVKAIRRMYYTVKVKLCC